MTLSFDETLDAGSVPDNNAFTVTVEGGDRIVQSIENDGAVTQITLVSPVLAGDEVTVSYTDPGASNDPLRDLSGNRVENFGPRTAVNNTPPTLESATVKGATVTLAFNNELHDDHAPVRSAFTVTVEGSAVNLATVPVGVSGRTVTLTLAAAVDEDKPVQVRYDRAASEKKLQDRNGNEVRSFDFTSVGNLTDVTPPALESAAVQAKTLTLTFDEDLDGGSVPDKSAFTVTVEGSAVELAGTEPVKVSGRTVTLTLAVAAAPNDSVEVSYADPGQSNKPLQDANGNRVVNFGPETADNSTPMAPGISDTLPPTINGTNLTITFTEALKEDSVPAAADFTVTVDDAERDVTSVRVTGPTVTLGLAGTIAARQEVLVSYTPGQTPLLAVADNLAVEGFTDRRVINATANAVPVFPPNAPTELSVPENSVAGTRVGTVVAVDADGEHVGVFAGLRVPVAVRHRLRRRHRGGPGRRTRLRGQGLPFGHGNGFRRQGLRNPLADGQGDQRAGAARAAPERDRAARDVQQPGSELDGAGPDGGAAGHRLRRALLRGQRRSGRSGGLDRAGRGRRPRSHGRCHHGDHCRACAGQAVPGAGARGRRRRRPVVGLRHRSDRRGADRALLRRRGDGFLRHPGEQRCRGRGGHGGGVRRRRRRADVLADERVRGAQAVLPSTGRASSGWRPA